MAVAGPPTAAPTFSAAFDGTLLLRQRVCDVVCARVTSPAAAWPACGTCVRHRCPSRHGLFVQGPMLLARGAATNAPPTTFASKPRAHARLLRPPLGRPILAAITTPDSHMAASFILRRSAVGVSSTWLRLAPVSHSRGCCAPVRGLLHAHRGFSLCTHVGTYVVTHWDLSAAL